MRHAKGRVDRLGQAEKRGAKWASESNLYRRRYKSEQFSDKTAEGVTMNHTPSKCDIPWQPESSFSLPHDHLRDRDPAGGGGQGHARCQDEPAGWFPETIP